LPQQFPLTIVEVVEFECSPPRFRTLGNGVDVLLAHRFLIAARKAATSIWV
jgi:hypothetical protein